jgi:cytochrome c-type biogenesis protein
VSEFTLINTVALPIGLGLLGFVEPCSIGSSLVFIKYIEGQSAAARIAQVGVFALTRALLIGALGALVALIGTIFLSLQKGAWLLLGLLYIAIGAFYAFGKAGFLMRSFGPSLSRLVGLRGSIGLGLLFGLNIPACAAPLIFALLGSAALGGRTGGTFAFGFVSLGLFGLALSAPLALAVFREPGRRLLDRLAGLSVRVPIVIGLVLIGLGLWSVYFGLFVDLADWS